MTTETALRDALARAGADFAPPPVEHAEAEVRRGRERRQRQRRSFGAVGLAVAVTALVIGVPRLGNHPAPQPGGQVASESELTPGTLRAGHYDVPGFTPSLGFGLGAGWRADAVTSRAVVLVHEAVPSARVGVARVSRVYQPGRPATRSMAAPRDLSTWVKTHPDVRQLSATPVRVGRYVGLRLELAVAAHPRTTDSRCASGCLALFDTDAGPVDVPAGDRMQVLVVNEGGRLLTIYAYSAPQDYSRFSTLVAPVVASLRLGG